ncbi:MAG: TenA family protein [Azospirillaceae bacterium]
MTARSAPPATALASFDAARALRADLRFTDWLREACGPAWDAMLDHRFTREIAADALPDGVFARYLRYEHGFVATAVKVFAHALIQAPTTADRRHVAEILEALTGEQERYFAETFARLGLPAEPASDAAPPPAAALALGDGALAMAAHATFEEILSMMLAAEWMYLTWCARAHDAGPRHPEAARWIDLHVGGAFEAGVTWTRQRLDTLGPALDPARQAACAARFRRLTELEIAFHDAPYERAEATDNAAANGSPLSRG